LCLDISPLANESQHLLLGLFLQPLQDLPPQTTWEVKHPALAHASESLALWALYLANGCAVGLLCLSLSHFYVIPYAVFTSEGPLVKERTHQRRGDRNSIGNGEALKVVTNLQFHLLWSFSVMQRCATRTVIWGPMLRT
jgi:hypothetical protein